MQSPIPISRQEPIGGRYEVIERVGEGNFAITYRARDMVLGRNVAVKVLREQYAEDDTFVSRFEREARVAASVSHPNVVDVYDFGPVGSTYYIAMQFVSGRTLKQELDAQGRMAAPAAVRIANQILHGLEAIHAAGIVHRDIKPQNVLLGQDQVARVTDFGVAHYPVQGALTTHGTTVGTASYMAPEQARGGALTEATDLYAVGVVLFELLTGRLPFEADNPMAVMLAHLQQPAPNLSEIAPDLNLPLAIEATVMQALAKDPKARFASAGDMSEALIAATNAPVAPDSSSPRADDQTLTVQVPIVPTAAPGKVAAAAKRPVTAAAVPPAVAPPLPPVRPSRRAAAWLAPLLLFGLALVAGAGLLVSSNGLPFGGGGDGDDDPPIIGLAEGTEQPSAVATGEPATTEPTPRSIRAVPIGEPTATQATGGDADADKALEPTQPAQPTATMIPPPAATTTPPPTPTLTPMATAPPTATPSPAPIETPLPEPTSIPEPTPTPVPKPTATVEPEPIVPDFNLNDALEGVNGAANAISEPTVASEPEPIVPDPGVIQPIESVANSTNEEGEAVPVEVDGAEPNDAASGPALTFTANDWRGAMAGDQSWYGRPWVALYGRDGAYARATLRFQLDAAPSGRMLLTVSGLGDESGTPFPFALEVNGVSFGEVGANFLNWNPAEHGAQGEMAPWSQIELNIPRDVFAVGRNEVTIVSLKPGANTGGVPYILLGDATLAPSAGNASATGAEGGAVVQLTTNPSAARGPTQGPSTTAGEKASGPDKTNRGSSGKDEKSSGKKD